MQDDQTTTTDESTSDVAPTSLTTEGAPEAAPLAGPTDNTPEGQTAVNGDVKGETKKAKPEPIPIRLKNDARIEWLNADGTVESEDVCKRSTAELLRFLADKVGNDEKQLERQVRIVVDAEENEPLIEGKPYQMVIAEGPLGAAAARIMHSTLPPKLVIVEFQRMCEFMSAHSALKGIMVTAVFGDAEVGGFGFLSSCSTITDADIITLGEAAGNQFAVFKDQIKRQRPDIEFPSDDKRGKLILPPRFKR